MESVKDTIPNAMEQVNNIVLAPRENRQVAINGGVIEVAVDKDSYCKLLVMQDGASGTNLQLHAFVSANGVLDLQLVTLCPERVENHIEIELIGEGAECLLNGLFLARGSQSVSTNVLMRHIVGGCHSNQLYKGILAEQSRGFFGGLIKVEKDAQKTEAYQANHNLVLTKEAKMDTQPHLEIYADDVKCSHGASIGKLDDSQLFYMRSRGIDEKEAITLQQMAFLGDVLERIDVEGSLSGGKEALTERIESVLRSL